MTVHMRPANKLKESLEPQFPRGANFKVIGYSKVVPKVILGPGTKTNEVLII